MNVSHIALASVGAFFAYFAVGGLALGLLPSLKNEFFKYPGVYRSQEAIKGVCLSEWHSCSWHRGSCGTVRDAIPGRLRIVEVLASAH